MANGSGSWAMGGAGLPASPCGGGTGGVFLSAGGGAAGAPPAFGFGAVITPANRVAASCAVLVLEDEDGGWVDGRAGGRGGGAGSGSGGSSVPGG